jgi:hypothetical protein
MIYQKQELRHMRQSTSSREKAKNIIQDVKVMEVTEAEQNPRPIGDF